MTPLDQVLAALAEQTAADHAAILGLVDAHPDLIKRRVVWVEEHHPRGPDGRFVSDGAAPTTPRAVTSADARDWSRRRTAGVLLAGGAAIAAVGIAAAMYAHPGHDVVDTSTRGSFTAHGGAGVPGFHAQASTVQARPVRPTAAPPPAPRPADSPARPPTPRPAPEPPLVSPAGNALDAGTVPIPRAPRPTPPAPPAAAPRPAPGPPADTRTPIGRAIDSAVISAAQAVSGPPPEQHPTDGAVSTPRNTTAPAPAPKAPRPAVPPRPSRSEQLLSRPPSARAQRASAIGRGEPLGRPPAGPDRAEQTMPLRTSARTMPSTAPSRSEYLASRPASARAERASAVGRGATPTASRPPGPSRSEQLLSRPPSARSERASAVGRGQGPSAARSSPSGRSEQLLARPPSPRSERASAVGQAESPAQVVPPPPRPTRADQVLSRPASPRAILAWALGQGADVSGAEIRANPQKWQAAYATGQLPGRPQRKAAGALDHMLITLATAAATDLAVAIHIAGEH